MSSNSNSIQFQGFQQKQEAFESNLVENFISSTVQITEVALNNLNTIKRNITTNPDSISNLPKESLDKINQNIKALLDTTIEINEKVKSNQPTQYQQFTFQQNNPPISLNQSSKPHNPYPITLNHDNHPFITFKEIVNLILKVDHLDISVKECFKILTETMTTKNLIFFTFASSTKCKDVFSFPTRSRIELIAAYQKIYNSDISPKKQHFFYLMSILQVLEKKSSLPNDLQEIFRSLYTALNSPLENAMPLLETIKQSTENFVKNQNQSNNIQTAITPSNDSDDDVIDTLIRLSESPRNQEEKNIRLINNHQSTIQSKKRKRSQI